MDSWRQKNCSKLNEIESLLDFFNSPSSNDQLIYSNCLTFIRMLKSSDLIEQIKNLFSDRYYCQPLSSQQFDNFILNTIKMIPNFTGRDEELVDGINLLQDYFLNQNMNSFAQALLRNKFLLEKHPKLILTIFTKIINSDDQKLYFKLISYFGQSQLKSYYQNFLKELVDIDLHNNSYLFNFFKKIFEIFLLDAEKFEQIMRPYQLTYQEIVQTYKRLLKWQSFKYHFIIQRLDEYSLEKQTNQEISKLIFFAMTSSISHLWTNQSNLIKFIKSSWKQSDQEFRFYRILKYMRINNHRDIDQSYRMGFNGLTGQKIDSFRLAQDFESIVKKTLIEGENLILYLTQIKQAFKREPYTFSYSFLEFFIQLPYEDNPSIYQQFWSMISKIYRYFFISLYEQDITNLFDFSGMFVDENGITKLITKTGNLKKNARNLIPFIQQLIINSRQILISVYKRFYKLFLSEKQIINFFTNFIYEPLIHQIEQQIPENIDFKLNPTILLYHQFPSIIEDFMETNQYYRNYLNDFLKVIFGENQERPMKLKGQLSQLIQKYSQISPSDQIFQILKNFHSKIMTQIFINQNEINISLNQSQYWQIKSGLQRLQKQQQRLSTTFCQEQEILQDVVMINYTINLNNSINSSCSKCFFNCLLKCKGTLQETFCSRQLNILLSQLDDFFAHTGYEISDEVRQIPKYLSEIDEIDQDGQYFQKIIDQIQDVEQIKTRSIPQCKQSYQLMIFLQLINSLLTKISRYDFEVELLSQQLRKLLSNKYAYDDLIIEIWNLIYQILDKLNLQSSEKWMENMKSKLLPNLLHLEQTISISTTLIISIILNQQQLSNSKVKIEKLFQLISQMRNQSQKQSLYRIIFNNVTQINATLINSIVFNTEDQLLKQQCILNFLKYIIKSNNANLFMLLIKIFFNIEAHQIQTFIIQFISQNLSVIGVRYLIIIVLGQSVKAKKTKIFAKKIIKQFTEFINQGMYSINLGQEYFQYLLFLNSTIFMIAQCQKHITASQVYWLFKKSLKYFVAPKTKQNSKKVLSIIQLLQKFVEWGQYFSPKQVDFEFSIFDFLDVNYQKLPEKVLQQTNVIKDQQEIFSILSQYINDISSGMKKQIDQQKKDAPQPIEIIDSMLFDINFEQPRVALKSKQQFQNIQPLFAKSKQSKNIEKVTKALDTSKQQQK